MIRRRVLAGLIGLAVVIGPAGCRSEPSVAVYLGDRKVSVAEVDRIAREDPDSSPSQVVSLFVCGDVGRRMVVERRLQVKPPDPHAFAVLFGLAEESAYVRLWAECAALVKAATDVEMARPLDPDESQRLVDALAAVDVQADVDQARHEIYVGVVFEAQKHFAAALRTGGVVVNPRYEITFPTMIQEMPLNIPFAAGSTAGRA